METYVINDWEYWDGKGMFWTSPVSACFRRRNNDRKLYSSHPEFRECLFALELGGWSVHWGRHLQRNLYIFSKWISHADQSLRRLSLEMITTLGRFPIYTWQHQYVNIPGSQRKTLQTSGVSSAMAPFQGVSFGLPQALLQFASRSSAWISRAPWRFGDPRTKRSPTLVEL